MKVGDRFTFNGKEYKAVRGCCWNCAFASVVINCDEIPEDVFNCSDPENTVNNIIAKEVSK